MVLAALFWSCAFLINEALAFLNGDLSFEAAGGHRAAAFGFSALLALATAHILTRTAPTRMQVIVAVAAIFLMPAVHAVFFSVTCKVAPIPGVAPMTQQEIIAKALLSTGYFSAWIALQLALIFHRQSREHPAAAPLIEPDERPDSPEAQRDYWASWRNQRISVQPGEIRWVEAQKDYAILHCATRSCIMRTTLSSLADELIGDDFVRVHRSAIVRRSLIASMHRKPTGALALRMVCGAEVPVGRSYAHAVRRLPTDNEPNFTRTSVA